MRIVHVLHSHGYGGAESHALLLMQRQRDAGHEVMYAGPADGWLAGQCATAQIPALHLGMAGLYDPLSHWRLRRLVQGWRPDVVHGHLVRGAFYAGRSVARLVPWGAPSGPSQGPRPVAVCTAHATSSHKHMDGCAHIIAVCQAVKDNLLAHGHPAGKVSVVYNGMPDRSDRGGRLALRHELGIPSDAFAVVNVGRFIHDKGQDMLVQALAHLPEACHLYLVGGVDTAFGQQVVAQAQAQGPSQSRVHFLGYRGDVQRILPAFDAYAVSSRREAFSLSIVEAFAASLACVATRVGGIPEAVEDGQTGLLVPVDDAPAMAAALARLCHDAPLREALATRARQRYLSRFTDERMTQDTLAAYQHVIDAARPGPKAQARAPA